jgi:hypothetical protein
MTIHEDVLSEIHREMKRLSGIDVVVSPTTIALAVQESFATGRLEPHIQYTSLEHLKQMARHELARNWSHGNENAETYSHEDEQGELFSGHLQDSYPLPRRRGEEPVYRPREFLSFEEAEWNADQLRKHGLARLKHADALLAWNARRRVSVPVTLT